MQMHSSYVVTDPKGTLLPVECGTFLVRRAATVIKSSEHHQLQKIHEIQPVQLTSAAEKDILKLVNTLIIVNTKGEGEKSSAKISGSRQKRSTTPR